MTSVAGSASALSGVIGAMARLLAGRTRNDLDIYNETKPMFGVLCQLPSYSTRRPGHHQEVYFSRPERDNSDVSPSVSLNQMNPKLFKPQQGCLPLEGERKMVIQTEAALRSLENLRSRKHIRTGCRGSRWGRGHKAAVLSPSGAGERWVAGQQTASAQGPCEEGWETTVKPRTSETALPSPLGAQEGRAF